MKPYKSLYYENVSDIDKLISMLEKGISDLFPNSYLKIEKQDQNTKINILFYFGQKQDLINNQIENSPILLGAYVGIFNKITGNFDTSDFTPEINSWFKKNNRDGALLIKFNGREDKVSYIPKSSLPKKIITKVKKDYVTDSYNHIITWFIKIKKLLKDNYNNLHSQNKLLYDKYYQD